MHTDFYRCLSYDPVVIPELTLEDEDVNIENDQAQSSTESTCKPHPAILYSSCKSQLQMLRRQFEGLRSVPQEYEKLVGEFGKILSQAAFKFDMHLRELKLKNNQLQQALLRSEQLREREKELFSHLTENYKREAEQFKTESVCVDRSICNSRKEEIQQLNERISDLLDVVQSNKEKTEQARMELQVVKKAKRESEDMCSDFNRQVSILQQENEELRSKVQTLQGRLWKSRVRGSRRSDVGSALVESIVKKDESKNEEQADGQKIETLLLDSEVKIENHQPVLNEELHKNSPIRCMMKSVERGQKTSRCDQSYFLRGEMTTSRRVGHKFKDENSAKTNQQKQVDKRLSKQQILEKLSEYRKEINKRRVLGDFISNLRNT